MKEEYVKKETYILAKEKGFDWDCQYVATSEFFVYKSGLDNHNQYHDYYSVPTQSLLQKWLREEKGIVVTVVPYGYKLSERFDIDNTFSYSVHTVKGVWICDGCDFLSYTEAMETGEQEALKQLSQ